MAYCINFGEGVADQEEKDKLWLAEEVLEVYPEDLPEEEIKKKDEEKLKKATEETEESTTVSKRKGTKLYVYGKGFFKCEVRNHYFITI